MTKIDEVTNDEINIFSSLKTKNDKNVLVNVNNVQKMKLSTLDTKSKMIRYLAKESYTTHQISKILSIRYQHVYNVLHQITKN